MVSTNSHCYTLLHEKSKFRGENHVYIVGRFLLKLVQYVAVVKFNKVFKNVLYFIFINPLKSEESLSLFPSICLKLNHLPAVCDLFYFISNYLKYFKNVCSKQHWSTLLIVFRRCNVSPGLHHLIKRGGSKGVFGLFVFSPPLPLRGNTNFGTRRGILDSWYTPSIQL